MCIVDLIDNDIGYVGIQAIAENIPSSSLHTIDLSGIVLLMML